MPPRPIHEYQAILDSIRSSISAKEVDGKVATYIPELAKIPPDKFGMHLCTVTDGHASFGDHTERFSIQSISKVLLLTLAMKVEGEQIWKRVGVEPSGNKFNSLVQLEYEKGIPRNPLINPGALVLCDILTSRFQNLKEEFLGFVRKLSGVPDVGYNETVAESEKDFGYHNRALINLMKAYGNIVNPVDNVLDFYFHMCSIEMSCEELATTFLLFARDGKLPDGETIITPKQKQRINALMLTCGFYDEAGEFAFRVGIPGKSGVGGGIVAIFPDRYSVAVWSPKLNAKGNSAAGILALEKLTGSTGSTIF
jgi:glutaminase